MSEVLPIARILVPAFMIAWSAVLVLALGILAVSVWVCRDIDQRD